MPEVNSPRNRSGNHRQRIIVVGAGLVGSLLSIYLARRGYRVEIYDKCADPREIDLSARRSSINLSLSERAFHALDRVGVGDAVRKLTVSTYGRLIHDRHGGLVYQTYGNDGEATFSIMRNDLNRALLDAAEKTFGVRCFFQEQCCDLDLATNTLRLESCRTGEVHHRRADRIFGADGVHSAIRYRLQRTRMFNFQQQYLEHGYKELNVPPSARGSWTSRTDAVHLWPRGRYMLLGLPNLDDSFVCSIHMPLDGEPSFASITGERQLLEFFNREFPDVVPEVPDLARAFFEHSINNFISVRCYPWCFGERVALIGDSAHAIFPFYAQGTNCGFEDCMALDDCLEQYGDQDWGRVLEEYQARRKPNADAISDLSRNHYREIRDQVGHPDFQLRKKIECKLAELDPERFMSLYTMVTFTGIPYAEALRRGREVQQIIDRLMTLRDIELRLEDGIGPLVDEVTSSGIENSRSAA